jgi:hypothetical protein
MRSAVSAARIDLLYLLAYVQEAIPFAPGHRALKPLLVPDIVKGRGQLVVNLLER